VAGPLPGEGPRKRHGLSGPIDDAFLDAFVFVRPTGTSPHEKVERWVAEEMDLAVRRWRTQMRGDVPIVDDAAVTEEMIATKNLVLWGDPGSNAVLARIAEKLPIQWGATIDAGEGRTWPAGGHVLAAVYPNPLNPSRYVVLNSGFTYRSYDDLNNARQTPKLPDWAVIDVGTQPDARRPGRVVQADFFDEAWGLRPRRAD
jgi:hypothetical protein